MQEHDIDVAERIQFAPAVATDGDNGELGQLPGVDDRLRGRVEQVAQNNVHETGALRADFPPPASAVMLQADAMVLDLEELLVERKPFRRIQLALGAEL